MADSGTVTILFTDLVGSTEMLERLGDDAAEEVRRIHFGLLREAAGVHGGHEVKSLGDGLMVAFPGALHAVACAVGMQQRIARHNAEQPERQLGLRVGLNVGEAITEEHDYFGTSVVVAKRLCDRAGSAEILAPAVRSTATSTSAVARGHARTPGRACGHARWDSGSELRAAAPPQSQKSLPAFGDEQVR